MAYTRRGAPLAERLEFYSAPPDRNGCRRWLASFRKPGPQSYAAPYPQLSIKSRMYLACRLVLEQKLGRKLKREHYALHTCDHPWCVAEGHLYEGTKKQNAADREERGRGNQPKRERHHKAKITEADVKAIRAATGTLKEIGKKYGLQAPAVWKIKHRINWP